MPAGRLRSLAAAPLIALLALAPGAGASPATNCGSVSYTVPQTHDEGHAALNNLRASGVPCTTARSVAHTFLSSGKAPEGWHTARKTIVTRTDGRANTVEAEILTHGAARVTGEIAN
jgi:hypothetical protein